ncbi:CaiB/BaiF CoA transferase family protein [Denitratisoma sp. DHT3]|uniref:CaiB/BaiF CoA transferase family protein n=1 Tax=Denitratisoma sp. DHT3 TaxID=1981880 RepID=UPI00164485E7|nr:CoA transferase [Denitratisoma sp. DHT3]
MNGKGPFHGIRVIELASALAAPGASAILADQGADVIKIEPPGMGDILRYMGASRHGVSNLFQHYNRGKRSLALNLKHPDGLAIVRRLAAGADVLLHNFRPGVAERLGVDYAALRAVQPKLIYVTVTGFGHEGPYAQKPAWDNVVQAFAGVAHSQADTGTGEPTQYYQIFADKLTALTAAQAIGAALFARERSGGGQEIRLAMIDAVAAFLWPDTCGSAAFLEPDGILDGQSLAKGNRLLRFRDGWAQVAPTDDASFLATCRILGEDVAGDPRFATIRARNENAQEVRTLFGRLYARAREMAVDETLAQLEAADVPCAKALRVDELPTHPQFQANGLFSVTDHPRAGPIRGPRTPARFGATPDVVGLKAPELGEHSEQILAELGWETPAAVLREQGVIA